MNDTDIREPMTTLTSACAYYDDQNEGWAYRLTFGDDHEESGDLDAGGVDDDPRSALVALMAAVYGVDAQLNDLRYSDKWGGSFDWRADA